MARKTLGRQRNLGSVGGFSPTTEGRQAVLSRAVTILGTQFRGNITPEKAEFAAGSLWFNLEGAKKQFKDMTSFQKAVGQAVRG